jgi:hypothetical protein
LSASRFTYALTSRRSESHRCVRGRWREHRTQGVGLTAVLGFVRLLDLGVRRFIIDAGTHIRLYDLDEYVTPAVTKLTEFVGHRLAA